MREPYTTMTLTLNRATHSASNLVRQEVHDRCLPLEVHIHEQQRFFAVCRHFTGLQVTIVTRHRFGNLARVHRTAGGIKREPGVTDSRYIGNVVGPGGTASLT